MGPVDLWYSFRFCTCVDEHEEGRLGNLYDKWLGGNVFFIDSDNSLGKEYPTQPDIPKASFKGLWRAIFETEISYSVPLSTVFRTSAGSFGHFESFLAIRLTDPHPPV